MIRFSRHILHYGGHLMWFMGIKNPGYAWIQSVILLFIFYRVSSYNIRGSQIAPPSITTDDSFQFCGWLRAFLL